LGVPDEVSGRISGYVAVPGWLEATNESTEVRFHAGFLMMIERSTGVCGII
jgi:hypothetical protein